MTFEKQFMTRRELMAAGLPRTTLDRAYADPAQKFAFKQDPLALNSPIVYETDGLAKWLDKQVNISKAMIAG